MAACGTVSPNGMGLNTCMASLTDPKVCFLYALLSDIAVPPNSNPVLPPSFDKAEILNTVACFVVCLRDLGMEEAASRLARQCITAVLNLSVGEQFAEEHHVEAGTTGLPGTDILHEIAECHREIASSLWGDQSANGVCKALVILFQAVEKGDWGWSTKKLYNLKPWLTPLKGEALLHELVDNSAAPLQVEASPAMFLALLCIMTYLNTRTLTAEHVTSKYTYIVAVLIYTLVGPIGKTRCRLRNSRAGINANRKLH